MKVKTLVKSVIKIKTKKNFQYLKDIQQLDITIRNA